MRPRRISRREALALGACGLAAWAAPRAVFANSYHGTIIGHGDFRYRVDARWGVLDSTRVPVRNCHEMVMDKRGRLILLTDEPRNNVIVYDRSGALIETWTLQLPAAHGLTLHEEGEDEFLYITDFELGRVVKTDLAGKIVQEFKHPNAVGAYESCAPYRPTETAIGPTGDVYVADGYGSQFILQYTAKGELIRKFGGDTARDHGFKQVHGVTLDTRDPVNPQLMCCNRLKNAFSVFTLDGKFVRMIDLPGAYVSRAVFDEGYLYTAVCWSSPLPNRLTEHTGFVMILDSQDRVVSNPGGTMPTIVDGRLQPMLQDQPVFMHPHDVCVDRDKNLYVPQWNSNQTYPIRLERV